jgi:hypothetical protein
MGFKVGGEPAKPLREFADVWAAELKAKDGERVVVVHDVSILLKYATSPFWCVPLDLVADVDCLNRLLERKIIVEFKNAPNPG